MKFTDRSINALKPKATRYEVWESGGFGVRVSPKGVKSWVWLYRYQGRSRRMTFGVYPVVSLSDARLKLAQARKDLERGIDPGTAIIKERAAERAAETVADLAEDYLERWARPRKRSADEDERMLRCDVLPLWGRRKAKDVTRRDVVALLDRVVDRGAPIMANRVLAVVRKLYNFGVSRDYIAVNPCNGVAAPGEENRRDRLLSADEIAAFWHGLDKLDGGMTEGIKLALKLQLVTAQRRGEIVAAEWSEIDRTEAMWTIPGEKAKNGLPHRVPLSDLALKLLDDIKALSGDLPWLFPSRSRDKALAGSAVSHAMRRNLDKLGLADATPHDLRRTAASHMTSVGISRVVVGKVLNHAEPGITATYDRNSYDIEKRHALDAWGARLESILTGEPKADAKVLPFQVAQG